MDPDDSINPAVIEQENMNPDDKNVAQRGNASAQFLPHDVKELEKVTNYAAKKEKKIQKLSDDFGKKGSLGLLWDSKVPQKNKKFYYCVSLSSSNREEVLEEIKKYLDFYKEMSAAVRKVSNPENETDSENINPYTIILDLNEKLTKMAQAAKTGEKSTPSSALYHMYKEFIAKHEKLENMIKRVECVALKDGLKKATDGWQESVAAIEDLKEDLQNTATNYDQMCERFDRLMVQNEQLLDQQRVLLENNHKMEQQHEILLQENAVIKSLLKAMASRGPDKKDGE